MERLVEGLEKREEKPFSADDLNRTRHRGYEMLLGRKAFGAASAAESCARILHGMPEGLTAPAPATRRGRLLALAQRCLQKEPRDRYASGVELLAALSAAATGKRSQERQALARAESGKLPGRRRTTALRGCGRLAVLRTTYSIRSDHRARLLARGQPKQATQPGNAGALCAHQAHDQDQRAPQRCAPG